MITNLIITAYCCCTLCCGSKATGLAANGKKPIEGITCAGPRSIPLGTKIYIQDIGYRTVTDRTAKQFDGRIDIFFNSHNTAKQFGIKRKVVKYECKHISTNR